MCSKSKVPQAKRTPSCIAAAVPNRCEVPGATKVFIAEPGGRPMAACVRVWRGVGTCLHVRECVRMCACVHMRVHAQVCVWV